jgi:DNA-binding MarR family transcriptional regulator
MSARLDRMAAGCRTPGQQSSQHTCSEKLMHRNLLFNMLRAVYWYCDALQDNLEAQGYPRTTRAIAFVLLNIAQGEHRAINIAKNLGISRQAVSQMLVELKNRDILIDREDPLNRRSRIVDFSEAFATQGAACAEILTMLDAEISRRVGQEPFKAMEYALARSWGTAPIFGRLSPHDLREGRKYWEEADDSAQLPAATGSTTRNQSSSHGRTQPGSKPLERRRRAKAARRGEGTPPNKRRRPTRS